MNTSNLSIIICGIVRNAEKGLKNNIPIIKKVCSQFKDYRVVIYENDSIDKTKKILKDWKKDNPERIHVLLNDTDKSKTIPDSSEVRCNPFFSKKRIQKMAALRNKYLEYINEQKWNADYLLVVDLDVAQLYFDGIMTSFSTNIEWDVITAFGYSTSPKLKRRYHDSYALTEWGDEMNPQTEQKIKKLSEKYGKLKTSSSLIRVFSAFGGLAIYKFELINNLRYRVVLNDDNRVEVRCEHFSICQQIMERKDSKIYINPSMALKYQNTTWKIIYNNIKRNLLSYLNTKG